MEDVEREFPATSYWSLENVKKKMKHIEALGGFDKVQVIQSYEKYVEESVVGQSATGTILLYRLLFLCSSYLNF